MDALVGLYSQNWRRSGFLRARSLRPLDWYLIGSFALCIQSFFSMVSQLFESVCCIGIDAELVINSLLCSSPITVGRSTCVPLLNLAGSPVNYFFCDLRANRCQLCLPRETKKCFTGELGAVRHAPLALLLGLLNVGRCLICIRNRVEQWEC